MHRILRYSFLLVLLVLLAPATSARAGGWRIDTLTHTPNDDLDPRWSPDGTRIAFVGHHEGDPEVYVLDVGSGALRNVSNDPEVDNYDPIWSPDGEWLLFRKRVRPGYRYPDELRALNLNTGTALTIATIERLAEVRWSPHSSTVYYQNDMGYYRYDLATHETTTLLELDTEWVATLLSPDAGHVALRAYYREVATYKMSVLDVATSQVQPLDEGVWDTQMQWSLDGRYLAYTTLDGDQRVARLYDTHTGQRHDLFVGPAQDSLRLLDWSVEGRLALARNELTNVTTLYVGYPPNLERVLAIRHRFNGGAWSPDGEWLAFHTYAGLYITTAAPGTMRNLVVGRGYIDQMRWSPSGQAIALYITATPRTYGAEIVVVDVSSAHNRVHELQSWLRGEIQWSPTRDRLVFAHGPFSNTDLRLLRERWSNWLTGGP